MHGCELPLLKFVLIMVLGSVAQLIGGSIGMGFGVLSTSGLLLLSGMTPAVASAIVHLVELTSSLFNGTFHLRAKNIDMRILWMIGIPGGIFAFVGATLISRIQLGFAQPWTASVLMLMGGLVLLRFTRAQIQSTPRREKRRLLIPLGAFAGFLDSTGGGGWGVVVTSTLMSTRSLAPRLAVGTSTSARLLVAMGGSAGFLIELGPAQIPWYLVVAMIVGGAIVAPLGPRLTRIIPERILGLLAGGTILILAMRQLVIAMKPDVTIAVGAFCLVAVVFALSLVIGTKQLVRERNHFTADTAS